MRFSRSYLNKKFKKEVNKVNIKVDVNLTAPELIESINRLVQALPNFSTIKDYKEEPSVVGITEPDKGEADGVRTTEPETKEELKKPLKSKKTSKEPAEIKEPSVTKESETKKISFEDVRAKLSALSQEGKQTEVKALITEFGAKKLSDIPEEKYAEILKRAEVL
jgi:hypothetical protein